ncbi:MAG: hypothetical protein IKP54_11055 [Bacteroidales bacterium]|nr:hypothetical protein [Bacteroidales bacterium]MBR6930108.1 hypothetical protein [Bacteroidales bacterium]
MEQRVKELNFAANLKASNIAASSASLEVYSEQIQLLLNKIDVDEDEVAQNTLKSCLEAMKNAQSPSSTNVLNEYIRFGDRIPFLLNSVKKSSGNIKLFKQIAICYLDIAKILKDERVNELSFAFADELIKNDN